MSIAQDRYGFLWFGTDDGLYRYDGYKLRPYRCERGNPNSLSATTPSARGFTAIAAAFSWVGTGFAGLDPASTRYRTSRHYRHDSMIAGV